MGCADRLGSALPGGASTKELEDAFIAKNVLFYIERSNNSNAVIYEANTADGAFVKGDPVKVYWIMYAKSPVNEEGLNMVERNTAYGHTCTENADGSYDLVLAALKTKKIKLSIDGDGVMHAVTQINNVDAELSKIYVENTTSWGMPKVKYIDLKGKAEGKDIEERINN
uniref:DUF4833 domain-containing protein n=1 Tax=Mucochytrium quahogii TaxID=96639 RepID=A0A7S2WL15_9STRA|mmetsp:Transcript_12670/g.20495  ORF Transcript_12670/g.20495 Transcript_12670/m.20495 type:complete len:169 (-) Transcript_12670:42-548(-)|eukprot:CAMPEP_0203747750 /NCGR_PEP_ID=MMETSP0098-20131031/2817_1 /ASSEMBLY_ACC=CAM_ASM_000208 /TAXON_ID=96639 /ORGANISM=" , Strain NY0313808BC1" /LENGTH=168 /DNA_ID=CAMNT_0050636283 /DNA_START=109 /DNA_END=615 /DNA_ORIENTATION=-